MALGTSACVSTLLKTDKLHLHIVNIGIKKRKGHQHSTRSRDRCSREQHTHEKKSDENKVEDYMHSQPALTTTTRADLINWVVDTHNIYNLNNETLYLAISIIDRFLKAEIICRSELSIVGMGAMLIASKYVEVRESEDAHGFVQRLLTISDPAYERRCIELMEERILIRLEWRLSIPTRYTYLSKLIKEVENPFETKMENMVYFYSELGMMNYEIITRFHPSIVAAAAVYAARATLQKYPLWHETMEKLTGYKEMQVLECAKMMGAFHLRANDDEKRNAIYEKYSSRRRDAVALYHPGKFLLRNVITLRRHT